MKVLAHLVLKEDVKNPTADRRKRDEFRYRALIPKGTRMRLFEFTEGGRELRSGRYQAITGVHEASNPKLFNLLMAAAEPREPTVEERLDEAGVSALEVLEYIKVTDEQILAAAQEILS